MKETLITLLGLTPVAGATDVSDEQIIGAVTALKSQADAANAAAEIEKAISDLMAQSCGALSRAAAKQVLETRPAGIIKTNG
jgi:hypothetical protein